jgi:uncharacterized protein
MGGDSWFEETMAFYDQYLTGKKPVRTCAAYAVQTGTRCLARPEGMADRGQACHLSLSGGSYLDDGRRLRGPAPGQRRRTPK